MADWNPRDGSSSTGAWGKKDDQLKENSSGPEICWDHAGQVQPLALKDMNEEEKDVRKPPYSWYAQNTDVIFSSSRPQSILH